MKDNTPKAKRVRRLSELLIAAVEAWREARRQGEHSSAKLALSVVRLMTREPLYLLALGELERYAREQLGAHEGPLWEALGELVDAVPPGAEVLQAVEGVAPDQAQGLTVGALAVAQGIKLLRDQALVLEAGKVTFRLRDTLLDGHDLDASLRVQQGALCMVLQLQAGKGPTG